MPSHQLHDRRRSARPSLLVAALLGIAPTLSPAQDRPPEEVRQIAAVYLRGVEVDRDALRARWTD